MINLNGLTGAAVSARFVLPRGAAAEATRGWKGLYHLHLWKAGAALHSARASRRLRQPQHRSGVGMAFDLIRYRILIPASDRLVARLRRWGAGRQRGLKKSPCSKVILFYSLLYRTHVRKDHIMHPLSTIYSTRAHCAPRDVGANQEHIRPDSTTL